MGSSNVTCGITHASIGGGDECVLIPLHASKKPEDPFNYTPYAALPVVIRGRYDDYGRIEDIVETAGNKVLEKEFGMPIKRFADLLVEGRDDYIGEFGTLMSPDLVDLLKDYSPFDQEHLKACGFEPYELDREAYLSPELVDQESWWSHPRLEKILVRLRSWVSGGETLPEKLWNSYQISSPWRNHEDERPCLTSLTIAWESGHKVMGLLNNLYQNTGIHLAYKEKNSGVFHRLNEMDYVWVHATAFDGLSKPLPHEGQGGSWWGEDSWISGIKPDSLEMLGFVYDKEASEKRRAVKPKGPTEKHRWWMIYRHPECTTHVAVSDGRWSHIIEEGDNTYHGTMNLFSLRLTQFVQAWKKATKKRLVVPKEEYSLCSYRKNFRHARAAVLAFEKDQAEELEFYESSGLDEQAIALKRMRAEYNSIWRRDNIREYPSISFEPEWPRWSFMKDLFAGVIKDGTLEDECVQLQWLRANLGMLAHPLRPMPYNGPQCGDYHMLKAFGDIIVEIAEDKLKERDDW